MGPVTCALWKSSGLNIKLAALNLASVRLTASHLRECFVISQ
jgi:hypothetical protein